jgi:(p)ppGpp synthase/HD superfamily hydrolase
MSLYNKALVFATAAHRGQARNYTGEPYVEHPIRVAQLVKEAGLNEHAQVVALLHDVLEDTPIQPATIQVMFGDAVLRDVQMLTDVDHTYGNRKTRKAIDADRLASGDFVIHSIKCADAIDNIPSIIKYDPNFAPLFLSEKRALLPRLIRAQPDLLKRALSLIGE